MRAAEARAAEARASVLEAERAAAAARAEVEAGGRRAWVRRSSWRARGRRGRRGPPRCSVRQRRAARSREGWRRLRRSVPSCKRLTELEAQKGGGGGGGLGGLAWRRWRWAPCVGSSRGGGARGGGGAGEAAAARARPQGRAGRDQGELRASTTPRPATCCPALRSLRPLDRALPSPPAICPPSLAGSPSHACRRSLAPALQRGKG